MSNEKVNEEDLGAINKLMDEKFELLLNEVTELRDEVKELKRGFDRLNDSFDRMNTSMESILSSFDRSGNDTANAVVSGLWDKVKSVVRNELSQQSFDTWVRNTTEIGLVDNVLVVAVPNTFQQDWLQSRYTDMIQATLKELSPNSITVNFVVKDQA